MPKIDPNTGERIDDAASQIDPTTGERVSPSVAGAPEGGPPQLPAHAAGPAMQSSLLAPSTYTQAAGDTAKGLITPLLHAPSQIASYGGFHDPSKMGGPIQSITQNPDKGAGVANMRSRKLEQDCSSGKLWKRLHP